MAEYQIDNENLELSEILDTFDTEEIALIVDSQILDPRFDMVGDASVDQFSPLKARYEGIIEENEDPDVLLEVQDRFLSICGIFLDAIETKFAIKVSDEWKETHRNDIPDITEAIYNTFVLNFITHVEDVLFRFIIKNKMEIFQVFEDDRNKRDASTISKKKNFNIEDAVILADIYDICAWILDNMTVDKWFEYSDLEEVDMALIHSMYESADLMDSEEGEPPVAVTFVDQITTIFKKDASVKGVLCFNLSNRLMKEFTVPGSENNGKKDLMETTQNPSDFVVIGEDDEG